MQVLRFVTLAHSTPTHKFPNTTMQVWVVEGRPQAMGCLLSSFMAGLMSLGEKTGPQSRLVRDKHLTLEEKETVDRRPARWSCRSGDLGEQLLGTRVCGQLRLELLVGRER